MKPSFRHFVAVLAINYSLGSLGALMLPMAVGALAQDGVEAKVLGLLGFLELAGGAIISILVSTQMGKLQPLILCVIGAICMAAGNLGSALLVHSVPILIGLRILVGVGTGLLIAGGLATVARLRNPDATYGYIAMAPCFSALLGFALAPTLIAWTGSAAGVFAFQGVVALFVAAVLITQRHTANEYIGIENEAYDRAAAEAVKAEGAPPPKADRLDSISMGFGLGSAFFLSFADSAVWAFVAPLASVSGISLALMSTILTVSALIGSLGPFVAGRLGDRVGTIAPLLVGQASMVLLSIVLVLTRNPYVYVVALYARVFTILFLHPRYHGLYARVDPTGGLVAAGVGVTNIGFALGPLIGGFFVDIDNKQFLPLGIMASCMAVISMLLTFVLVARRRGFLQTTPAPSPAPASASAE